MTKLKLILIAGLLVIPIILFTMIGISVTLLLLGIETSVSASILGILMMFATLLQNGCSQGCAVSPDACESCLNPQGPGGCLNPESYVPSCENCCRPL